MIVALLILALAGLGAFLMLVAGLGILRMPDLYTRMHASTKAPALGLALILAAAAIRFDDPGLTTKVLLTIFFVFLTAPVAAHLLGRAAYVRGVPLWEESVIDEARGKIRGREQDGDDEAP